MIETVVLSRLSSLLLTILPLPDFAYAILAV